MTTILSLIGWPLGLACMAVTACAAYRGGRARVRERRTGALITALIFLAAACADFGLIGVLSPVAAAVLGGLAVIPVVLLVRPWHREAAGIAWGHIADGAGWARDDARSLLGRLRRRPSRSPAGGEDGPVPLEAVAEHAATRAIPSVMEDPLLGPATEPGEIAAAGIAVPAPYAALASYIAGFDPEDDQAQRMFMDGHASGMIAVADAWHAHADHCLNGVGLSPAYVAGILEAGNSAAEHASLLTQVHKRFGVVYAAVKEWIAAHGPLPHKAREFLTGED